MSPKPETLKSAFGLACPCCRTGEKPGEFLSITLSNAMCVDGQGVGEFATGDLATQWGDDDPCTCPTCGFTGHVRDFLGADNPDEGLAGRTVRRLADALRRCTAALAANGAPNCEAAKEARAALNPED